MVSELLAKNAKNKNFTFSGKTHKKIDINIWPLETKRFSKNKNKHIKLTYLLQRKVRYQLRGEVKKAVFCVAKSNTYRLNALISKHDVHIVKLAQ